MSLRDELKKALLEATKARDSLRLNTIRSIQSEVKYKEIDAMRPFEDVDILKVITSLAKKHRESIEQFQKANRQDLVEKEQQELALLESYLPVQVSQAEIEKKIAEIISEMEAVGPQDMGKIMKPAMAAFAGRADGKLVSETVKKLLSA